MTKRDAARRRRDILTALLGTAGATLVLGLLPPFRVLLVVNVVTLVLLAAYMALLVRVRKLAEERARKVRRLPTAAPATEPALVRTAAN